MTDGEAKLLTQVTALKAALRKAILNRGRVVTTVTDHDPAGNSYYMDWAPEVVEWAALCDLNLDEKKHLIEFYSSRF